MNCTGSFYRLNGYVVGHDISVECLYDVSFPVDVGVPSISPLVKWDHSQSWLIPEWPEFYCRGIVNFSLSLFMDIDH